MELVPLPGSGFVGLGMALAGILWAIDEAARRMARLLVGAAAALRAGGAISPMSPVGR